MHVAHYSLGLLCNDAHQKIPFMYKPFLRTDSKAQIWSQEHTASSDPCFFKKASSELYSYNPFPLHSVYKIAPFILTSFPYWYYGYLISGLYTLWMHAMEFYVAVADNPHIASSSYRGFCRGAAWVQDYPHMHSGRLGTRLVGMCFAHAHYSCVGVGGRIFCSSHNFYPPFL